LSKSVRPHYSQRILELCDADLLRPHAGFDPPLAKLMRDAFLAAWESVKASGSVDAAPYRSEWARETLALRIIDMAQVGERDVRSAARRRARTLGQSQDAREPSVHQIFIRVRLRGKRNPLSRQGHPPVPV
jgi:hypothetical protein